MDERAYYRAALANLTDGVYFVDREQRITYWNDAAERITGYGAEELLGRRCRDNVLSHTDAEGNNLCERGCPLAATMADGEPREAEIYVRHRHGHLVPVVVRVAPIRDADGRISGGVEVFTDHTSRMSALDTMRELRQAALLDPLTGLGNRRCSQLVLGARLAEADRYGWQFGLLFADIDRFKRVNDTYGHRIGDEVLKMVARTLQNSLRPFDFVGRWGGEEFVALVVGVQDEELRTVAERARSLVERAGYAVGDDAVQVTVSVGATGVRRDDTVQSLLQRGDRLMYAGKAAGRNRVVVEGDV
jgi:diguanylate cyclase (GGDEF)-like protein/PAS domain S-box-containing protein